MKFIPPFFSVVGVALGTCGLYHPSSHSFGAFGFSVATFLFVLVDYAKKP